MQTTRPPISTRGRGDVKSILKAELKRRGLTYADLVTQLASVGVVETEANLRNKISRGSFTAAFFVQCLVAIGCDHVRLGLDAAPLSGADTAQVRPDAA